jgi:hypothetical protein
MTRNLLSLCLRPVTRSDVPLSSAMALLTAGCRCEGSCRHAAAYPEISEVGCRVKDQTMRERKFESQHCLRQVLLNQRKHRPAFAPLSEAGSTSQLHCQHKVRSGMRELDRAIGWLIILNQRDRR